MSQRPDPKAMLKRIFELSAEVTKLGQASGRTVGTAESCTGGLIGAALTAAPGSSRVFSGGIIAYSNAVKTKLLNVPEALLDAHGAVSSQTAQAMARGALEQLGVDISVSVTGVAGPSGGSADKPVGTVWMGLAVRKGEDLSVTSSLHQFPDMPRNKVRDMTCLAALETLIETLNS